MHMDVITGVTQKCGHMLQVLFIGLVLIPVRKVTLNFLASPVMAPLACDPVLVFAFHCLQC